MLASELQLRALALVKAGRNYEKDVVRDSARLCSVSLTVQQERIQKPINSAGMRPFCKPTFLTPRHFARDAHFRLPRRTVSRNMWCGKRTQL